ncbi:hypothetical protein Tco_0963750 [Tanacetum coccineum]
MDIATQLNELSSNLETDSENSFSVFDGRSSNEESTPANDRSSKADGYKVVPPPITRNFLTPRRNKELVLGKPSVSTTRTVSTAMPISTARPSVSTARPVYTARPSVCTARPSVSTARPVYANMPIYPRMDNVRPRCSCSPIKRSHYTKLAFRPKDLKQDVKTFGVQNMTTVGTRAVVNTGKGNLNTDLKKSRWVWRPKENYLDHVSKDSGSFMLKKVEATQRSCYRIMQWWIVVALAI